MINVASLESKSIFRKAFSQLDVFRQFVHDVLDISMQVEDVSQGYKYPERVGHVETEYDLFAKDIENRIVVQVLHIQGAEAMNRLLYHHAIGQIQQMTSYRDVGFSKYLKYPFDNTVHTVGVLTADAPIDFSVSTMNLNPVTEFGTRAEIYPQRLVCVNPRIRTDGTPESIRPWLELIDDSFDGQVDETRYPAPIFQQVIEAIRTDNLLPQELK